MPSWLQALLPLRRQAFDPALALLLTELIGLAYVHYFNTRFGRQPSAWPRNARNNYEFYAPFQLPRGFELINILTIDPFLAGKQDSLMARLLDNFSDGVGDGRVPIGFLLKYKKVYYLILRGTAALPEWIRDSLFEQTRWILRHGSTRRFLKVHHGFARLYSSIQPAPQDLDVPQGFLRRSRLIIAGHSLGGALAQLCALELHHLHPVLYTFATPRVGDAEYARVLEQLVPQTYRVEHSPDPFIQMPGKETRFIDGRRFQYEHGGHRVPLHTEAADALVGVLRSGDLIHAHQLKTYGTLLARMQQGKARTGRS